MDNLAAATLLVICNAPDAESAERIASILVERRLAACVNIGMPVQSVYRWQGAVEHASEIPLMIKTSQARYAELESTLLAEHPYEVPEILAFSASSGAAAYLNWIAASTTSDQPAPAQR
jgi:periplasmic divalent cation tolerance protein